MIERVRPTKGTLKEMMDQVERWLLIEALREHRTTRPRAAKTLGITREGLAQEAPRVRAVKREPLALVRNVRRRRSPFWALAALMLVVGLVYLMHNGLGVWFLLFPGTFAFFFAKRTTLANILASEEGLRIDDTLIPRARLTSPLVRHEDDTTYVTFAGRRAIDVEVKNNLEADALLEALALDAGSAAIELTLTREPSLLAVLFVLFVTIGVAALPFLLLHTIASLGLTAAIVVSAILLARMLWRVRLRVGTDGVMLRELFRRRFVPHAEIADVEADGEYVVIRRTNGTDIRLHVLAYKAEEPGHASVNDEALAVARRLRQAHREHRDGAPVTDLSAALDRGARTTRQWLDDLRKLGEGTVATFRTVGVAREQIFDVVTSTTATSKDRIAALVALRPSLDADEETRIRVATEKIAAPELRVAMERVLDEDDEAAMTEALEAVDHE